MATSQEWKQCLVGLFVSYLLCVSNNYVPLVVTRALDEGTECSKLGERSWNMEQSAIYLLGLRRLTMSGLGGVIGLWSTGDKLMKERTLSDKMLMREKVSAGKNSHEKKARETVRFLT